MELAGQKNPRISAKQDERGNMSLHSGNKDIVETATVSP